MKRCTVCGTEGIADDVDVCPTCRRTSGLVAAAPAPAPAPAPGGAGPDAYPCGHTVVAGSGRCPHCESDGPALAIEAPWGGTLAVPESGLFLGRLAEFSPYAEALAAFDTVSRRHATLRPAEGGILVEDPYGSRNGTFVDDVRLRPGEPVLAPVGATIRFGADEPVVFRVVES